MPDKLTDAEVKKALECYRGQKLFAFNGKKPEIYIHDIIDLINRQDQENESLKAEVERLKNAYKQCAWERDIFAEDMTQEIKKDCSYLMLDIKTIKAEAYKEFAERLKKKATTEFWSNSEIRELTNPFVTVKKIDNFLNELVGDGDGK